MNLSKSIIYFCFCFIGGIFLASCFSLRAILVLSIISLIFLASFPDRKKTRLFSLLILFFCFGAYNFHHFENKVLNAEVTGYNDLEEEVVLEGKICKEPIVSDKTEIVLCVDKVTLEGVQKDISGKILVFTDNYPGYDYLEVIKVEGFLKTPQVYNDFDYKGYLAKKGISSVLISSKIESVSKSNPENIAQAFFYKLYEFKLKLKDQINSNLAYDESAILSAMLLGDKSQMSESLKERLNVSGLRHISAISGMHIVIWATIVLELLLFLGLWRQKASIITVVFLFIYVLFVGAPASAVRAFIMISFVLIVKTSDSLRSLLYSAVLILAFDPLSLKYDVGFLLSFFAVLSMICFGNYFKKMLDKISNLNFINNILAATFSAQILTLPILIYNFGYFSLISPLSNLLVVPTLPYILISGFIFSFIGIFFAFAGWMASLFCSLLLMFLVSVVNYFSVLPFASLSIELSIGWMIFFYLITFYFAFKIKENEGLEFLYK